MGSSASKQPAAAPEPAKRPRLQNPHPTMEQQAARRKPLQNPHPTGAVKSPEPGSQKTNVPPVLPVPESLVRDAAAGARGEYGRSSVDLASFDVASGTYQPLQNMHVGPEMMAQTTRAQLFPDTQQSVLDRIRVLFLSSAWHRIKSLERHHADVCRSPRVVAVEPVEGASHKAWETLERVRCGTDSQLLGCEVWTVDRCGAEQQRYRIHYFRSPDDAYWVRLLPTNASGAADVASNMVLGWMGGYR